LEAPAEIEAGQIFTPRLSFANRTGKPLVVLKAVDKTAFHYRFPNLDLYVRDESNGFVYRWAYLGGTCAWENTLLHSDHATFAPGEQRTDIANGWVPQFQRAFINQPGSYTLWAIYRFCGYSPYETEDYQDPAVHVGVHASNGVRIEVTRQRSH